MDFVKSIENTEYISETHQFVWQMWLILLDNIAYYLLWICVEMESCLQFYKLVQQQGTQKRNINNWSSYVLDRCLQTDSDPYLRN